MTESAFEATVNSASEPLVQVLILAGGKSSRMGQDKALLEWHGVSLISRICQVALHLSPRVQVLSPWPDRYTEFLPEGVEGLQEALGDRGPLWALKQGLSQCQAPWMLLLACDMPRIQWEWLHQLRSHLNPLPESCLAYVPQTQHQGRPRWEPLCGFYRQPSLSPLTHFLNHEGRSFQHWLTEIRSVPIPLDEAHAAMLFNCNSPEDWEVIKNSTPPPLFIEKQVRLRTDHVKDVF